MSTQSPEREIGGEAAEIQPTAANLFRTAFQQNIRQSGMLVALAVIVLYFQFATRPAGASFFDLGGGTTLKPGNVSNVIQQNGYILILAIGMVIVIICGHIDLSVGSIAGFVGAVSGVMIVHWGWAWWAAIPACLLVGALVGAWQ